MEPFEGKLEEALESRVTLADRMLYELVRNVGHYGEVTLFRVFVNGLVIIALICLGIVAIGLTIFLVLGLGNLFF